MKVLNDYIEDMLIYKESLGFTRKTYKGFLNDFASYLQTNYRDSTFLTERMVQEWCVQRKAEKASGFRRRALALREFTKYLYAVGASDYILQTDSLPKSTRYTPYIFSDKELVDIFACSDNVSNVVADPCKHLVIPVIYRLIYYCGLRPNEGRELKKCDVDSVNETLLIRKTNHIMNALYQWHMMLLKCVMPILTKFYLSILKQNIFSHHHQENHIQQNGLLKTSITFGTKQAIPINL